MPLRYAIIGTGAIGGYYGGKLANAGKEVHFLLHSDYEYVKANGLKVDSVCGDFHLKSPFVYKQTSDMPKCDVILVCLKSNNNKLLVDMLPPLLHPETLVILIQNGLGLETDLQKDFPKLNIAGGLAFICSNKIGDGHIAHLDYGKLNIGSYSCKNLDVLNTICSDFAESGIKTQVLDLEIARWKKLVWNIPYNGMTVVLNTTTDKLMNNTAIYQLLYDIMLEVIRGANHVGKGRFSIPESFAQEMLDSTMLMAPYSPSMKLDYDSHRPLEIEYIYTRPIEESMRAGYEMSRIMMLEKQLIYISENYSKK